MKLVAASLVGIVSILALSFTGRTNAEKANSTAGIRWYTWEEAIEMSKVQKRKIMVDVYTQWCGWCKRMDQTTFQNKAVVSYLNSHYYPIKFDAETKADIEFRGKTYRFVKNGMRGYHELAAEITRGRLSYPTIVFLDEEFEVIQSIPGYREPLEFEQIITYFGTNSHKKMPWEKYRSNYTPISN
ncbi:MAG: thioredoxin [Saprospirales bacterium]|nr:thioredoxin [Saprospirales bacterium]